MKKLRSAVVALVILVATWACLNHRVRIGAWLWHLEHGTALPFGDYVVPVPAGWYVDGVGAGAYVLMRLDTNDHTPKRKLKRYASIGLLPENPMKNEDLSHLLAFHATVLKKEGVDPLLQRTFSEGSETIYCIGGDRPGPAGVYDAEPVSWRCKSAGGLDIVIGATEPDMKQVWEIISGIHKKS